MSDFLFEKKGRDLQRLLNSRGMAYKFNCLLFCCLDEHYNKKVTDDRQGLESARVAGRK